MLQWYLSLESSSPSQIEQASNVLSDITLTSDFMVTVEKQSRDQEATDRILNWFNELPSDMPSLGLRYIREGPVDCTWGDGAALPVYAYLFDQLLLIASHHRKG